MCREELKLRIIHRIALNIREKGRGDDQPGRLKAVQGIGWWLEERNIAQVEVLRV